MMRVMKEAGSANADTADLWWGNSRELHAFGGVCIPPRLAGNQVALV